MELRPELQPKPVDERLARTLADLAAQLDGARPGEGDEWLEEFHRLAGTSIPLDQFQGIYGAEEHIDWVRRLLGEQTAQPVAGVTREELIEVVRRAMPQNGHCDAEAYMAVFDANVPRQDASSLIFFPPDFDAASNTWGGGRMIGEYDPTPEQIVDWALQPPGDADQTA